MQYIVDFHNDAPDADITQYLTTNGCTVLKEWNNFDKVYLVEAAVEPPVTSIVAHVVDDSNTLACKPLNFYDPENPINNYHRTNNPNYPEITISTTDQKDWWKNYTLANPVFDQPTTTITQKGNHIHVYIMDSGIEASHPEFEGVDVSYVYSVTPNDFSDKKGHGTALASIISGKTCGISSAKLKIVKIYDPSVQTLQSNFLDALDAVMEDVPEGCFAVLNCSWSIPKNEWVEYKLRECIRDGVWVVAAAGNSGVPIEDVTPASMPDAFTVGAYNQDLKPCAFSDYTGTSTISYTADNVNHGVLDGWAPGQDIWSAHLNGTYGPATGTSMSAAITSAVIAYNLSDTVTVDGRIYPDMQGVIIAGPDAVTYLVVGRKDLLDLSDPKYANSKNAMVTLVDIPPGTINGCTDVTTTAMVAGTKGVAKVLFNPHNTKSIEIIDPFPTGFTILPSGTLWADISLDQAPTGDETFVMTVAKFKRVLMDDTEEVVTVDVYILKPNYQPSDLPEDHPINVTFLGSCNNFPYTSCQLQFVSYCDPKCNYGGWCCDSGKYAPQCICVDSFGPTTL